MTPPENHPPKKQEGCGCQQDILSPHFTPLTCTCTDKNFPFSVEELTIYSKLRELLRRAGDIKERLVEIETIASPAMPLLEVKQSCMDQLSTLRKEWADWKERCEEAQMQRMAALGHIDSSEGTFPKESCRGSCPLDQYP